MNKKVFAGVNKKYPIVIGKKSILKDFLPKAVKNNSKILIVTDTGIPIEIIKSVSKILEKGSKIVKIHKVAKGEKSKSFAQFERIIRQEECNPQQTSSVIARLLKHLKNKMLSR